MAQTVESSTSPASGRASENALVVAATFFAAVVLLHNFDHVRRGADTAPLDVLVVGTGAIVLEIAVVVLCLQRHRLAALAAAWSGLVLAVGYLVVHFTPPRAWLSDSLLEGADTLSLAAATLEVVAAAALAITGFLVLRARPSSPGPSRPLTQAVVHPIAAVTILGNAAAIVIAFAQR